MNSAETKISTIEAAQAGQQSERGLSKGTLLASIITGIAASTCCVGPLVLLTLGISGSWIGNLSAMEPFRPYLMGLTLIFLGLVFRKLYLVSPACAVDAPCATPSNLKMQRILFWVVSAFILIVMTFPWYGPYFLD
ncbi:MAG: mercuric transporter MerT family protein [Thiohalomonadales bacterium]